MGVASQIVQYLREVADACIDCGLCTQVQREENQLPLTYGSIASRLVAGIDQAAAQQRQLGPGDIPEDVYDFTRSCLTCGRCTADCPVDIRGAAASIAARAVLASAMPRIVDDYRRYRCDYADSHYSKIREGQPFQFEDMLPRSASQIPAQPPQRKLTLFFPGCTLNNNYPALSQTVYRELRDKSVVDGTTTFCCGRPLSLTGVHDEFVDYGHELCKRLLGCGVGTIVAACPNCYYTLREMLQREGIADKVQLRFLAQVLVEQGYRFQPSERHPYQKVSFHDSCPDRHDGIVADSTRQLFQDVQIVEMPGSREHSICCGSGGLASVYAQTIPQASFGMSVSEFFGTRARCLITSCATCAYIYKVSQAVNCKHYLELLFDAEMDVEGYSAILDSIRADDGTGNAREVYDQGTPFFVE